MDAIPASWQAENLPLTNDRLCAIIRLYEVNRRLRARKGMRKVRAP